MHSKHHKNNLTMSPDEIRHFELNDVVKKFNADHFHQILIKVNRRT